MGVEWSRWSHICPVEDFWPLEIALSSFTATFFAPFSLPYTSYLGLRVQFPMNLMERCFRVQKSRLPLNVTQSFATWCGSFVQPHDSTETRKGSSNVLQNIILPPFLQTNAPGLYIEYEITLQWIQDVCWPFCCFLRAGCSVTKPAADGYLYIGWLTFKVRCKSMQVFLVLHCWFLGVVSSPSLPFHDADDHGGEQSLNSKRKRGRRRLLFQEQSWRRERKRWDKKLEGARVSVGWWSCTFVWAKILWCMQTRRSPSRSPSGPSGVQSRAHLFLKSKIMHIDVI